MAKNTCGKTTIDYDDSCSFVCNCHPSGCNWTVSCPVGGGRWIETSGTGRVAENPPANPTVTVVGTLEGCAKSLEKLWKRRVIVPATLRRQKIRRRTLKGTREEIAEALGLRLGARRATKSQ